METSTFLSFRAQRSLPVSIISTVDLMRLALLDEVVHLEPSPSNQVDDTHLRLAYSMALVRFVNLSTGRQKVNCSFVEVGKDKQIF